MKLTVGALLGDSFDFVRGHPRSIAIWAGGQAVISLLAYLALRPFYAQMAQRAADAANGPAAIVPSGLGYIFAVDLVFLFWLVALFAAVVRTAARPGEGRFANLRFGMDEMRLIGVMLAIFVAYFAAEIVAVIIGFLIVALGSLINRGLGTILMILFALVACAAAIWANVRISLVGAVTVLRGRIAFREAWTATGGAFWPLLGAYLVIGLVFLVLEIVIIAFYMPGYFGAMTGGMKPEEINAALQAQAAAMGTGLSPGLIVMILVGIVFGTLFFAYYFGLIAIAALRLTAAPPAPPVFGAPGPGED